MGEPVGLHFGQIVRKFRTVLNLVPESRLPFAQIGSFTGKRPKRPEAGVTDGFEEMEHEFPLGIFRPEK